MLARRSTRNIEKAIEVIQTYDIEKLLKTFFQAGITPDFAEKPKDVEALEGEFQLFQICVCNFFTKLSLQNIALE